MSNGRRLILPPYPANAEDERWVIKVLNSIKMCRRLAPLILLCPDVQMPRPKPLEMDSPDLVENKRVMAFVRAKLVPAHPRYAGRLSPAWLEQVIALNVPRCTAQAEGASRSPLQPAAAKSSSFSSRSSHLAAHPRPSLPCSLTAALLRPLQRAVTRRSRRRPSFH